MTHAGLVRQRSGTRGRGSRNSVATKGAKGHEAVEGLLFVRLFRQVDLAGQQATDRRPEPPANNPDRFFVSFDRFESFVADRFTPCAGTERGSAGGSGRAAAGEEGSA